MRRAWFVWLAIGVIGVLLLAMAPVALLAQNTNSLIQVFVIPPVTTSDSGSTLGVRVPFRLLDAEGNSVENVRITDIKLWLEDMPPGAINFGNLMQPIEQISAPLYVTIVIDVSGSMDEELADVRNAARTTVERAPANVLFRIVTFHGDYGDPKLQTRQDFTADRNNLRNAIDTITESGAGTCYYDAIYEELDRLATAGASPNMAARKAVMAFTDGRDMVNDEKTPCSRHTIDEVIGSARNKAIPIYTLGLAGNLDVGVLTRLADETQGIAVIGAQSELSTLFSQAFAGIVNQYEAEFAVLPVAGRNRAYVEVSLANTSEAARSALFEFDSPRSFIATPTPVPPTETPLPPPTATLIPSTYVRLDPAYRDNHRNQFVFPISISNPRIVEQLFLRVLAGSETKYRSDPVDVNGRDAPTHEFRVDINVFEPGREYKIQVIGVDITGHDLLKPMDNFNKEPDPVLAELGEFTVEAEPTPTMTTKVNSVTWALPDSDQWGKFFVELAIDNQQEEITQWRAYILDESNKNVMDTDKEVFKSTNLVVPMPSELLQAVEAPQPKDYKLYVNLWGQSGAQIDADVYEIKAVIGPIKPGFFAAIWIGINANPLIAIAIVVVISSIALYFVFGRKPARPAYSLARSAEEYTVVAGAAGGGGGDKHHGKLAVDVFETPSPGERKKQSFNRFPCVIGRSSQCDVRLAGDSQLSRRHAQLVLENGRILLTDLGSNNGTFVDEQRINANTATPLSDGQVIRLGRQTRIRIGVSY
jgi:hypothetical protein